VRHRINVYKCGVLVMLLESTEVLKDDKDSGLDVLVFGADVNSDEACAQRSKCPAFINIFSY